MEQAVTRTRYRREQARAIETRDRIIDAAASEFAQNGFEGASLRKVAAKANARHTAITYYFNGKEGLWLAVFERRLRDLILSQKRRLEGLRGVDDVTKLRILMEDFVRHGAEDLELHKLMTQAASGTAPEFDPKIAEFVRMNSEMMRPLMVSAQKAGAFIEGDPDHLNYIFIGAATRLFMQAKEVESVTGRSPFEEQFVEDHVRIVLSLFFKEPQRRKARSKT